LSKEITYFCDLQENNLITSNTFFKTNQNG